MVTPLRGQCSGASTAREAPAEGRWDGRGGHVGCYLPQLCVIMV